MRSTAGAGEVSFRWQDAVALFSLVDVGSIMEGRRIRSNGIEFEEAIEATTCRAGKDYK